MITYKHIEDNFSTMIFSYEMEAHTKKFKTDEVVRVQNWWTTDFETIPADAKQQIIIDNRKEEAADLVK